MSVLKENSTLLKLNKNLYQYFTWWVQCYIVVINLIYPLKQDLCCQYVRYYIYASTAWLCSQCHYLYAAFFLHAASFHYIENALFFTLVISSPPPIAASSTSRSICGLFLCLSIRVPWFPWDWILSQIMLGGGLSFIDPLGSTALCRGSEVWEMWCIWPRGCTSAVFSDDLPVPAARRFTRAACYSRDSTHINNSTCTSGGPGSAEYLSAPNNTIAFKCPCLFITGC